MDSWIYFVYEFIQESFWEIFLGSIIIILTTILVFGRNKIKKYWFKRKIKPKFDKSISLYEKEILPEFVETRPKIKVIGEKEKIPDDIPFGYIFVPEGEEELIWNTLITYVPVSSSMKGIRILFDENLRKALFDLLSYELGLKLNMENLAVNFRDNALRKYREDFEVIEKIYYGGKLTTVILMEASERFRRTRGRISLNDIEEFSILVRKIAEIDAKVVRVGEFDVSKNVEEIFETGRGIILLARGRHTEKAISISESLKEKGYELISEEDLGLPNPQTGIWRFVDGNEVPFIRIWLRKRK